MKVLQFNTWHPIAGIIFYRILVLKTQEPHSTWMSFNNLQQTNISSYVYLFREMVLIVHGFPNMISALRVSCVKSFNFVKSIFYILPDTTWAFFYLLTFLNWHLFEYDNSWADFAVTKFFIAVLWTSLVVNVEKIEHTFTCMLQFEWAWTKPNMSRRLHHVPKKKNKETKFMYCVRVMCSMLRTGPWSRLPLTIRWLKQEYEVHYGWAVVSFCSI